MSQAGANSNTGTGANPVETLTGNSGGAVGADGAMNIDVLGNNFTGIDIVGTPASNLLTVIGLASSETQVGTVELATDAETGLLTDTTRAVTPSSLKAVLYSPYTVNPDGTGAYPTIQSALDAANTESVSSGNSQTVVIRPGTYTENLTLYPNLTIWAAGGQVDASFTVINGVHALPTTGTQLSVWGVTFLGTTAIFTGSSGSCQVNLFNVITRLSGVGYTFDIDGYSGQINLFDFLQDDGGTNGFIFNPTGNAPFFFISGGVGFAQSNAEAVISGAFNLVNNLFTGIKWKFVDNAQVLWNMANYAVNTFTFEDNSSMISQNSSWATGANAAIINNSTGTVELADVNITSSAVNVFEGTGTIQMDSVTFGDSSGAEGTLTLSYGSFESGEGYFQNLSFDRGTSLIDTDGQLIIGSTGNNPQISTLTGGTGITITNGAGSITIDADNNGDVTGPGSSTDNALARWNGTGGDTLQDSTVIVTDDGEMTNASQPAFLAYLASSDLNETGDNTTFFLGDTDVGTALTEVVDQSADFTPGASGGASFTAPSTGNYSFNLQISVSGGTSINTGNAQLVTSNRTYRENIPGGVGPTSYSFDLDVLADIDGADTVQASIILSDTGGKVDDITGAANLLTYISGTLSC